MFSFSRHCLQSPLNEMLKLHCKKHTHINLPLVRTLQLFATNWRGEAQRCLAAGSSWNCIAWQAFRLTRVSVKRSSDNRGSTVCCLLGASKTMQRLKKNIILECTKIKKWKFQFYGCDLKIMLSYNLLISVMRVLRFILYIGALILRLQKMLVNPCWCNRGMNCFEYHADREVSALDLSLHLNSVFSL
jgi:hypothetical protein